MSRPKTDAEWFRHNLYNDPEFMHQVAKFETWSSTITDQHGFAVLCLLVSRSMSLKQMIAEKYGNCSGSLIIDETAKYFEVPHYVIEYGFIQRPDIFGISKDRDPTIFTKKNSSTYDGSSTPIIINNDEVYIRIGPNTRLKDVESVWFLVNKEQKRMVGYIPQSQASYKPNLIYAIYKQRLTGSDGKRKSFERIFALYQEGALPDYDGSTALSSSDSLERHFRRHMPKSDSM